jgi:hypothetical protein
MEASTSSSPFFTFDITAWKEDRAEIQRLRNEAEALRLSNLMVAARLQADARIILAAADQVDRLAQTLSDTAPTTTTTHE